MDLWAFQYTPGVWALLCLSERAHDFIRLKYGDAQDMVLIGPLEYEEVRDHAMLNQLWVEEEGVKN